jgi:site-specific DNA-methyltransferase (adenine-specific)
MTPYYSEGGITIYHGDCREILPSVWFGVDVCVSDPPYGMNWNTDHTRFQTGPNGDGPGRTSKQKNPRIASDRESFDPTHLIGFRSVVLWGFLHFANKLPKGSVLVWLKRYDSGFGSFLSDADLAWMKGGEGVYCRRDLSLQGEERLHPTQKPTGIMEWCITKAGPGALIDPYMGSGTTLLAAKNLGRHAIGIEIEERYCEIAAKRLAQGVLPIEAAS